MFGTGSGAGQAVGVGSSLDDGAVEGEPVDDGGGHVRGFGQMLTQLQGERLPEWIAAVRADDLPSRHTFINGLERDLAAVTAGLTLPCSSGIVEGHVNRTKTIKRQMYGRAGFKLLRKRVLLAS
ncbi:hypothetical protein GCM10023335_67720 [Streptomyces siamensis]|uniref:Transposase IS204/IS1001/IS1096/IS1165 DDE domain-containing protein n=1 Tax=Streptomyces siamensis TaxID=1274986 RepID=A0ABP9JE03_9ACTN